MLVAELDVFGTCVGLGVSTVFKFRLSRKSSAKEHVHVPLCPQKRSIWPEA